LVALDTKKAPMFAHRGFFVGRAWQASDAQLS